MYSLRCFGMWYATKNAYLKKIPFYMHFSKMFENKHARKIIALYAQKV